ncbi:DUF3489 domain-containing protein [Dankookia rubra]|uniref:DUF3489 domain-containing protein n=1 Tax=Dankookia rubra TaxID=1442381 RepID=UPI0019D5A6AC|nr:DUF3489 domain-containing protein [Dankookia rubra]
MLNNLLKQGYVEECAAPDEFAGLRWHQQDGTRPTVRITEAGMAAIGVTAATEPGQAMDTVPADMPQAPGSAPLAPFTVPEAEVAPTGAEVNQPPTTAALARPSLRDAAQRVLAAWDDEAGERAALPDAVAALRAILVKPAPAPRTAGPRKPRGGTKQQQVLVMLRRPEGATIAQIMEATGWQAHTARGFFAGLKKRQGIAVDAAERVRQVGPGKEGARGSYTIYRVARQPEAMGLLRQVCPHQVAHIRRKPLQLPRHVPRDSTSPGQQHRPPAERRRAGNW